MSQNPKTYFLLLFLVTFSFASLGQDAEKPNNSKNVLDRIELEATVSFFENQQFNIQPGVGGQVSVNAPLFNGGLRLGLGVGISKLHYQFKVDSGYHDPLGTTPAYKPNFDMTSMSFDFSVGTDFFRKSNIDLILDIGARMYVPLNGNYSFNYPDFDELYYYNYPSDLHSFEVTTKFHPAVFGNLAFKVPISNKSALMVSYGFSLTFLKIQLKNNSYSNGIFYQHEWVSENSDNDFDGYLVGVAPTPIVGMYDYQPLELPSILYGGQHIISIGYRYTFGLSKKKE